MPTVNHAALSAGVIAVSFVVAAGIAIYESPELRRMAEDLRRRIAVALYSLGDSITPQERENLFNRPEDAEGFLRSRGIDVRGEGGEQGVDADEETRRRQREELMYWNALADEKREKELRDSQRGSLSEHRRGSSFDDFLKQDTEADKGTYVFNSSADIRGGEAEGLRHRGDASRGLAVSAYTNPFADEHSIDEHIVLENSLEDPADKDETGTDIYTVSNDDRNDVSSATLSVPFEQMPALVEFDSPAQQTERPTTPTVERQLAPEEYMTAGQEDRAHDAYTSIQAWAQNATSGFYSPLPVSPARTTSEPELVSDGALTPTDSASVVDVADEVRSVNSEGQSRSFDILSESEGMATPASWSEVGSVVSENDAHQPVHA